ncbi:MAG: DUF4394 domain-containing protein [Shimia sp.]
MLRTLMTASVLALAAAGAHAQTETMSDDMMSGTTMGYALAGDGMTLVVMDDISMPGDVRTYDLGMALGAIEYRPVTGDLIGISDGMIVTIDPMSGETTDLGADFMDGTSMMSDDMVDLDFNNQIDAVRAVTSSGGNSVYFPEGFGNGDERAGSVRAFTQLAYAEGDLNEGQTPQIFANAYTNAISGMTAESTLQYALDAQTNALVTLANNEGTLETVGFLEMDGATVDIVPMGGFDIVSPEEGNDMAYAILQIDGQENAGLYSVNLETAQVEMLADLGMGGFTGFATSMGMGM